jgi:hypothetical protein
LNKKKSINNKKPYYTLVPGDYDGYDFDGMILTDLKYDGRYI